MSGLLIIKETLSEKEIRRLSAVSPCVCVIAPGVLEDKVRMLGYDFVPLESLVEIESIYEANAFLQELSGLHFPDGTRLTASYMYKGYEVWWVHYTDLFLNFCLPFIRYRRLLEHLKNFEHVYFFEPVWNDLFRSYLSAHGVTMSEIKVARLTAPSWLPFGVLLQVILTLVSLPLIVLQRKRTLVFTGDRFDSEHDFDFRMRFVYEELRARKIPFVEFVRSLQPWKIVLQHALKRKRPVVYPVAIYYIAQCLSLVSFGRYRSARRYRLEKYVCGNDGIEKFKFLAATQYLRSASDDVWAIRIMRLIVNNIGVKAAFVPAANERNFHTVLGCKLAGIPTVGILHGVAMANMCVYDFMPGYEGTKPMSLDVYGVWSEWWKQYYVKNGKAYTKEQLHVSGPMRPLQHEAKRTDSAASLVHTQSEIHVLFISEEVAIPSEVLPYLNALITQKNIRITIKFRPYRDEFEKWLLQHAPDILKKPNLNISREKVQDAIKCADVVIGSYSTAALEAFIQLKPSVFFRTKKWGDYFDLKEFNTKHSFFAENPEELIEKIFEAQTIAPDILVQLRERYFGDPYKNGSAWVVDQLALLARK